jgi:hypothetical protein
MIRLNDLHHRFTSFTLFFTIATIIMICDCGCDAYSIISTPKQQVSSSMQPIIQRQVMKSYRTRSLLSSSTTKLFVANVEPTTKKEIDYNNLSYGESSRIYRRDVFNYDAWVEHRSTDRFVGNIFDILKSGVFRQLLPNCFFTSSIAFFVIVYNAICVNGYDDFNGIHHISPIVQFISFPLLKIPGEFFNLCTPSLALLLGMFFLYIYATFFFFTLQLLLVIHISETILFF